MTASTPVKVPERIRRSITPAQRDALVWLKQHGGTAIRMKWPRHMLVMAAGEVSPYMAVTYRHLEKRLLCTLNGKVFVITPLGNMVAEAIETYTRTTVSGPTEARGFHPADFDRVDEGSEP